MPKTPYPRRSVFVLVLLWLLLGLIAAATHPAFAQENPIRIIWLHHSVGFGIIDGGGVREGLTERGYEFFDHGYNGDGLRLADGTTTGTNFDVPDDNTYPDGLANVFTQTLHDPPDNTFSYLMQYDVIMVKSCFPTSNIGDDATLEANKEYYRTIAQQMDAYPNKLFIIVTHPPQVPNATNADEARRARALNDWLLSGEFQSGHTNLFVFDLFGRLAGPDNLLRSEYRVSDDDAHPNDIANAAIGPEVVDFVDQTIRSYWGGGAPPPSGGGAEQPSGGEEEQPAEQPPEVPASAVGVVDDFEAGAEGWHGETDRVESIIECGADGEFAHDGGASLRIHFDIASGGWINCGKAFDEAQNWGDASGISLWLMADKPDQWITLGVYSGDPLAATPFEVFFAAPEASLNAWSQVTFAWTDFKRAEWADPGGLTEIEPTSVTGYNVSLGTGEERNEGILWVDDVSLLGGTVQPSSGEEAAATQEEQQPGEAQATEEATEAQTGRGGLCRGAGAVLILPIGAVCLTLLRRRRG